MTSRWPAELVRVRDVVARDLGLVLDDDSRLSSLAELIARRLGPHGDVSGYVDRLEARAEPRELRALAAALTIGETYFFRNGEQFRALAEQVLPERAAVRRPVRILSAGCASGEEAYTVAMVSRGLGLDADVTIRAVDVNPDALARAARARYTAWAMRETPPDAVSRWFQRDGTDLVLDAAIQGAVRFDEHNLTVDDPELWAPGGFDVVFCRNVLMYFTPAHALAAVGRITRALAPGGYLFLGHAETLRGLSNDYHLRHTHGAFYYQRKDVQAGAPVAEPTPSVAAEATPPFGATWIDTIQTSADRIRELSERGAAPARRTRAATGEQALRREPALGRTLELLQRERYTEALAGLEDQPRDRDLLLVRAALLAHGGRLVEAERTCTELLEQDELSAGAHYLLALCREGQGDLRGAADHDQVAVYLDPSFAMARLHLGLMARRAGDHHAARRELAQAARLLAREDPSRVLLFGGGFARGALIAMCAEPTTRSPG